MKDASEILQEKYFEAIDGVLMYNGENIPVYDSAAVDADVDMPYVLLSAISINDDSNKESFGQEIMITIDVNTKFSNSFGGKKQALNIADQIMQLIARKPTEYFDLSPDFYLVVSKFERSDVFETLVNTGVVVNKRIVFKNIINEINE